MNIALTLFPAFSLESTYLAVKAKINYMRRYNSIHHCTSEILCPADDSYPFEKN
jgi:hypothetical protein